MDIIQPLAHSFCARCESIQNQLRIKITLKKWLSFHGGGVGRGLLE